jgi:hypothetical protein
MPTGLTDDVQRAARERDRHRCLECGAEVATDRGGCPGTLMRLCFPCHATKGLRAHAEVLRAAVPDRLPEFVKQMTWDFGLNLLAYSVWIDPLRFDPGRALGEFGLWRRYLDRIAALARDARPGGPAADFRSDAGQ